MKFFNRLFVSKDGELSVIVSGDCLRDIRLHALQAQGLETGSVLMGRSSSDGRQAFVERCAPITAGSTGSPRSFVRSSVGLESYYKDVYRTTNGIIHYVGEWHSHPYGGVSPSAVDDRTMMAISVDMKGAGVVSIIVGGDFENGFEVGLSVYLGNRRIRMLALEDRNDRRMWNVGETLWK